MHPDLFKDATAAAGEIDFSLPVISIRQPWAEAIVAGLKDVENRSWRTHFRGPVLIHAGSKRLAPELDDYLDLKSARGITEKTGRRWLDVELGGIVGMAEIVDCVSFDSLADQRHVGSPWFTGPWGWVLRNARRLPFYPCRGALGFFRVKGGGA